MEFEITLLSVPLLVGAGFLAGFINTIAGGGSMLTLPAFMMLGLPADIANGTNRVGIFLQSVAGARGFHKKGKLAPATIVPTLIPSLLGALLGSILASYLPVSWLKPALLVTMLTMAMIMLINPSIVAPPPGTPTHTLKERPLAWVGLLLAGIYGGFVQAGVGFILIAALAGGLRYDLVRTNALKMAITATLTLVALTVFVIRSQVLWIPGLIMAAGTVAGAMCSVQFAIAVPQSVLKWVLFVMVLLSCAGAYFS
ncbi:MAG: sulfite exporter TauE/SafE family protein [Pseudomonadales bacterium]|nr:sulfite exporter TauE/SafE family protein [Pseudomonadales bacterium]